MDSAIISAMGTSNGFGKVSDDNKTIIERIFGSVK